MKDWILKKLLKNVGQVGIIIRSGQPGFVHRWLIYKIFKFRSVINLAHAPITDKQDNSELKFCKRRNIPYYGYSFGAGGPQPYESLAQTILGLIGTLPGPVWIHCEGGKDRTGGIVMRWMLNSGYSLESVIEQARKYKVPAEGWLRWALELYE